MAPNSVPEVAQDRAIGNFSAGPACLSDWVMRTAAEEFFNKDGTGMGILEVSRLSPSSLPDLPASFLPCGSYSLTISSSDAV